MMREKYDLSPGKSTIKQKSGNYPLFCLMDRLLFFGQ
jgi:hypothetical protein